MSFWSIARVCVHQAQECTTHQHFYPDEVETHLAQLGTLSELLAEFRCSPAIPEETVCELLAWEEEVSRLSMILQQEAESTDQQGVPETLLISTTHHPTGGHHSIDIDIEVVLDMLQLSYKRKEIASMARISSKTLTRHLQESGVKPPDDVEVDGAVTQVLKEIPNAGLHIVRGGLRSAGFLVTKQNIRSSLLRLEPEAFLNRVAARLPKRIRHYWVSHSNACWHFDGHEKLARW